MEDAQIVHALSNHLSVILGFVEIVIADTPLDHPRRRDLLGRADKLMYEAKADGSSEIHPLRVKIEAGELVEMAADEYPE